MKINLKAFTFVELVVVITILAILFGGSIVYFGDFADSMTMKNKILKLKDIIEFENNKINNKEIFDYKIIFLKDKNYYLLYENIVANSIIVKFDNISNGIGYFSFSGADSGTGEIKYYKNYKFQKKQDIYYNKSFTGDLSDKIDYRVTGTFFQEDLNNIFFDYFDYKNDIYYIGNNTEIINIMGKKNYDNLWLEFENEKGLKDKVLIN